MRLENANPYLQIVEVYKMSWRATRNHRVSYRLNLAFSSDGATPLVALRILDEPIPIGPFAKMRSKPLRKSLVYKKLLLFKNKIHPPTQKKVA